MELWSDDAVTLHLGDCAEVLAGLPAASVDSVVTDPPYALNFMGKDWDSFAGYVERNGSSRAVGDDGGRHDEGYRNMRGGEKAFQEWCEAWARECYRVLKPGGHLLAFGGTRTYHRLACGIEDAGFEIRDSIHWIYGTGFPKSLDVSKAIDKAAGAQREVVGEGARFGRGAMGNRSRVEAGYRPTEINPDGGAAQITAPATEAAAKWAGWGTALKPAHEPIVVARKPIIGTVAANVLAHGTGALNIDVCRVGSGGGARRGPEDVSAHGKPNDVVGAGLDLGNAAPRIAGLGRWPPNILLTHSPGCVPAGEQQVRGHAPRPMRRGATTGRSIGGDSAYGTAAPHESVVGYGDADGLDTVPVFDCEPGCPVAELDRQSGVTRSTGGHGAASREAALAGDVYGDYAGTTLGANAGGLGDTGGASRFFPVFRYEAKAGSRERPLDAEGRSHATVKPKELMAWLVKLVTPPGGLVLDPFGGSGTTAEACIIEGRRCIIIEKDPGYAELIRARLDKPIQPRMF